MEDINVNKHVYVNEIIILETDNEKRLQRNVNIWAQGL